MASSLPSFESFGSPAKPGSSSTHLCRSVKRMFSGSVSGNLSASRIPTSSELSQSSVGMLSPRLVFVFAGVVAVPLRNLDDHILRAVGHELAAQARLRREPRRFIELIELRV